MTKAILAGPGIMLGALLGVAAVASPAAATWSIVAVDPETAEVGAAIASCVPAEVLGEQGRPLVPLVLIPGTAAAVTQAQLNLEAPGRIVELVAAGAAPAEIIDDLTADEFDDVAQLRQHAVVALPDEVAAFTGSETSPDALDRQGPSVSVQGNLLVGPSVVEDALTRFLAARDSGADLASALVDALVAGSEQGGDRRCGDQTALFAQVVVFRPSDAATSPSTLLTVTVSNGDGQNPVPLLADAHRSGRSGLIEAGATTSGSGALVRTLVLGAAVAMAIFGAVAFKRGLGSVRARR